MITLGVDESCFKGTLIIERSTTRGEAQYHTLLCVFLQWPFGDVINTAHTREVEGPEFEIR